MVRKNRMKRLIIPVIMIFVVLLLQIQPTRAQAVLTIAPITWNIIGLDSNNVAVGPDTFLVGARVCNTGGDPATNVVSTFVWDTTNTYINLAPGSLTTLTVPSLAAGSCFDFYYNVRITRNAAAYDTTRRYHIAATADGVGTISTPTPRELYVEHLVSQNRNSVNSIVGPTTVFVGQTYTYVVNSSTSTNGYEQLESFLDFPNILFRIESVAVTYSVGPARTTVYADACGWINDPTSPDYRTCTTANKAGGTVVTTYTVHVISAGTAEMSALIYDFSGSSYHYNSDFSTVKATITVNAYDPPTIAKSFSPNPVVVGQPSTLTFTLTNPNPANLPALTGVAFTDSLPSTPGQMVVANPPNSSTTGCGTPIFNPQAGDTSLNFSGGTLTSGVTCVIKVDITVPTAGTYLNTTSPLTPGGDTASDTLTALVPTGYSLSLVKLAQLDYVVPPSVGDLINYNLTATNTGQEVLTGVTISDPSLETLVCNPVQPATLAPGASLTCTGSHTLTQADIDAGSVNNTANADSDQTAPTSDDATVIIPQNPALNLLKSATPTTYSAVGQTITYKYQVTNTGNVTLSGPFTVSDDRATVTCPVTTSLAPGASIYCTASYTITQADMDAGSVTNFAVASRGGLTSNQASSTVQSQTLPEELPSTGFAPGHPTLLSVQPAKLNYAHLGDFWLEIPALNVKAPIVGVPIYQDSWQLDWLGDQVGYLEGTAFPTWKGNSVLTGHVYDAYGQPGPFVNLRNLYWGQQVIIHGWGQSYIYEIRSVQYRVNPDNTSVITHEERPWLTLITCQGYDEESDSYSWRIVVRAVLVKVE